MHYFAFEIGEYLFRIKSEICLDSVEQLYIEAKAHFNLSFDSIDAHGFCVEFSYLRKEDCEKLQSIGLEYFKNLDDFENDWSDMEDEDDNPAFSMSEIELVNLMIDFIKVFYKQRYSSNLSLEIDDNSELPIFGGSKTQIGIIGKCF